MVTITNLSGIWYFTVFLIEHNYTNIILQITTCNYSKLSEQQRIFSKINVMIIDIIISCEQTLITKEHIASKYS